MLYCCRLHAKDRQADKNRGILHIKQYILGIHAIQYPLFTIYTKRENPWDPNRRKGALLAKEFRMPFSLFFRKQIGLAYPWWKLDRFVIVDYFDEVGRCEGLGDDDLIDILLEPVGRANKVT